LVTQIDELQDTHKQLQDDVIRFEHFMKTRSADVRAALDEITTVLDDPDRLRSKDGIEPADIEDFEADDYPPIAVEVVALNDLEAEAQMAAEATARPGEVLHAAELEELAPEAELPEEDVELDVVEEYDEVEELEEAEPEALDEDPEIGVQTQTVTPQMIEDAQQPPIVNGMSDDTVPPPPPMAETDQGDPFLDELRRVTTEDPQNGDAIADFLDDKQERGGGGWFGRRK